MAASPTHSRVLQSLGKEILFHVRKYFLEEKAKHDFVIPPSRAVARTAKSFNVNERTVHICLSIPVGKGILSRNLYETVVCINN